MNIVLQVMWNKQNKTKKSIFLTLLKSGASFLNLSKMTYLSTLKMNVVICPWHRLLCHGWQSSAILHMSFEVGPQCTPFHPVLMAFPLNRAWHQTVQVYRPKPKTNVSKQCHIWSEKQGVLSGPGQGVWGCAWDIITGDSPYCPTPKDLISWHRIKHQVEWNKLKHYSLFMCHGDVSCCEHQYWIIPMPLNRQPPITASEVVTHL